MSYQKLIISADATLMTGIKQMDEIKRKLLIVYRNNKFFSLLSIGDIQRAILRNSDISQTTVYETIKSKQVELCYEGESVEAIRQKMLGIRCEFMPVLNENGDLKKVYYWEDFFMPEQMEKGEALSLADVPVVIMAGGKGERLQPITNILPKPLIPMGKKPIVQVIMEKFRSYGATNFIMSVNYRADMIKFYFDSLREKDYQIEYIAEEKPLGTAGSLFLLKDKIRETFFVSNCDIIIDHNYPEVLEYHRTQGNSITAIGAMKFYSIPYGTFNVKENGQLISIQEKPELTYLINTGMYILEPEILDLISDNEHMDITELMEKVNNGFGKVGIYPINSNSWVDIGSWKEYNKVSNIL
jgi:dTDP-glucose pyrophosphorylase